MSSFSAGLFWKQADRNLGFRDLPLGCVNTRCLGHSEEPSEVSRWVQYSRVELGTLKTRGGGGVCAVSGCMEYIIYRAQSFPHHHQTYLIYTVPNIRKALLNKRGHEGKSLVHSRRPRAVSEVGLWALVWPVSLVGLTPCMGVVVPGCAA